MDSRTRPHDPAHDPIRAQRRIISHWSKRASHLGYALFGVSMIAVIWGFVVDFTPNMSRVASASLIAGCVVLAPAILVLYAVKAADRDDKERGL